MFAHKVIIVDANAGSSPSIALNFFFTDDTVPAPIPSGNDRILVNRELVLTITD